MVKIQVKGHEIDMIVIKDSFDRRAQLYMNTVIAALGKLGVSTDDIDLELNSSVIKSAPATVFWYFAEKNLHFSYSLRPKYIENLYVLSKVITIEVTALLNGDITLEHFLNEFSEEVDVLEKRKEARVTLGLDEHEKDVKVIDKAYRDLARAHHPDTETGDAEKFKTINTAHKVLKRELR